MDDPRDDLHPIVEVLAAVLEDGPRGVPRIRPEGLDKIRVALDEYIAAGPPLMGAVDQLLTAAHLLEVEKGAMDAARGLVELVDRKVVVDALIAINEAKEAARADAVAKKAEDFKRFTAKQDRAPTPPPAEEKKDKKAVKLDAFHFPKRL